MKKDYLKMMRDGLELNSGDQIKMIFRLSIPAILAQISSIIMQYIDASMVGRLGAGDSASIGLIASSTWLIGGLCSAASTGFSVLIAKRIGAKDFKGARSLVNTGLFFTAVFSLFLAVTACAISPFLPVWLGGDESICSGASVYFLVFSCSIPVFQLNITSAGMIQCSGNMKVPGALEIIMCVLDVLFNAVLIFPSSTHVLFGLRFKVYGAGLGLFGSALGTALAELCVTLILLYYLLAKSKELRLRKNEKTPFSFSEVRRALKIALPVAAEQIITCSAYIAFTRIVSPLGTIALAANSFSITAESLCYMPGYGIGSASSTIIGQSIGAKRNSLSIRLGRLATLTGVGLMSFGGILMFFLAPYMIGILTPDPQIRQLGSEVLRIEAFAEPLYAASIVATGVFRGAGDTIVPTCINLFSMWLIRIPLAAFLASGFGLRGVWTAMCVELCIRGSLFIILLLTRFTKRINNGKYQGGIKSEV